jgi:hypothetical protein
MSPWIWRHVFLQIGTVPTGKLSGLHDEGVQPFFSKRIATNVKTECIKRFFKRLDLRARARDFGTAKLGKIFGTYVRGEQADDDDDDEKLKQGKSACDLCAGVAVVVLPVSKAVHFGIFLMWRFAFAPHLSVGMEVKRSMQIFDVATCVYGLNKSMASR